MRSLLLGVLFGVTAGGVCAALLWTLQTPIDKTVATSAIVGLLSAAILWVSSIFRTAVLWLRTSMARRIRRQNLAAAREREPTMRYGLKYAPASDDETVLMGDKTRVRLGQKHIHNLLKKARAAASANDFHKAADLYSDLLDGHPEHVDARLERGRIYLDMGDYVRAMSDFVYLEDLDPDSPLPLVAIGDLHFARKDYASAITCFDIALSIAPSHAMAFCRRGISHSHRGHHDLALADLLAAKRLDPDIPSLDTHIARERKKAADAPKKRKR